MAFMHPRVFLDAKIGIYGRRQGVKTHPTTQVVQHISQTPNLRQRKREVFLLYELKDKNGTE